MSDNEPAIRALNPLTEISPIRAVHPNVSREQLDLYENMLDDPRPQPLAAAQELVATLTRNEIARIEEYLPAGATVESIIGHELEFHESGKSQRHGVRTPIDGHVDVDA